MRRQRSKQEIANLKSELQKLQQESKAGAKGKDLAQKDVDALKYVNVRVVCYILQYLFFKAQLAPTVP